MAFKVKDLMIDVTSVAGVQPGQVAAFCRFGCTYFGAYSGCHLACTYLAVSACHYGCSFFYPSICQYGSVTVTQTCPGTLVTDTGPIFETPQTVADVEMLEKKLGEALDELRARKAELKKGK